MKLTPFQMGELHRMIWQHECVRFVAYNKYGKQCIVSARVKALTPEGIVVDYDTLAESASSSHVPVEAMFYTELKKGKGLFKKASLRDGFFVEKIMTNVGFEFFENDVLTIAKAKKIFAENFKNDRREECDIAIDPKYIHYNQFIGNRVSIFKNHGNETISISGVLEYATKVRNSEIYLTIFENSSREDVRVVPNVDDFFVVQNGFTFQIFALADEGDVRKMGEMVQGKKESEQGKDFKSRVKVADKYDVVQCASKSEQNNSKEEAEPGNEE